MSEKTGRNVVNLMKHKKYKVKYQNSFFKKWSCSTAHTGQEGHNNDT